MKKSPAIALSALMAIAPVAGADDSTAREIMQRVEDRDDGDRSVADIEMVLIDRNDRRRVRRLRAYAMDVEEGTYQILFFLAPADVKDTGFLTYDYDEADRDDDQWLYLPALHKTKRIASRDQSGSFMGSDLSYADMTTVNLEHYDLRLMEETAIDGIDTWQIEMTPRSSDETDRTGYTRSVVWVRKDRDIVIRGVYWIKKGSRLKYVEFKKLEQIDGIWVPTEIHATTRKGRQKLHRTVMRYSNLKFDQPLDEDTFTLRRLEKGE